MLNNNSICRILGIKFPLIQAPMNWINNAQMVAAVSNAGALGVLGPNAGPKVIDGRRLSTEERIGLELSQVRRMTSAPVGVNIFSAHDEATRAYAMKTIAASKANDVNIYCLVGTFDESIYSAIKDAGGILVHRELTPTPDSVRVAEEHGADIIVATGIDEGGTLPSGCMGTFTIVPT
ncbi:MAG: nitronate monooxygenase, partial [Muribaculum sp.]|nr:nitronate monooxygenase [Muribaculum sp.]